MAQITLNSTGVASNGSLVLQSNGTTTAVTVDASQNVGIGVTPSAWGSGTKALEIGSGTALWNPGSSTNTALLTNAFHNGTHYIYRNTAVATNYLSTAGQQQFFTAASGTAGNIITFTQAMTLTSAGELCLGATSSGASAAVLTFADTNALKIGFNGGAGNFYGISKLAGGGSLGDGEYKFTAGNTSAGAFTFSSGGSERARIDSSGNFMIGTTAADPVSTNVAGISLEGPVGSGKFSRSNNAALDVNRITNDGELVRFYQDGTQEGNISVSGTTVSYNGGHLSRYAQTTTAKDDSLLKGTVLSNLDEMSVYTKDGQPVANEQLNKVKVSDTEGDANVAGVFVNWSHDEVHNVDEINMAMTGDMIIRIAQGTTVVRGDLLMSAGNGTAKPQGDDIVRSKTIAKVTSNHVTCTYADGSYCVPCVLMAC